MAFDSTSVPLLGERSRATTGGPVVAAGSRIFAGTGVRAILARATLLLGIWSIPGLISSTQIYFLYPTLRYEAFGFGTALIWQMTPWLFWAPMTPFILWLTTRFRFDRTGWPGSVVVHLAANGLLAFGHLTVAAWAGRIADQEWYTANPILFAVGKLFTKNIHLELLTYWGVVATGCALEYHRRFREREIAASQLAAQLATAQLEALKMQLHPHFLFNTLHAIGVMVRKQDTQGAVRMLAGVSDLLRITLENVGRQTVPLKQELDFLDRYLDVERTRFQDRLTVRTHIAPDTLDASIPNLLLQPVVENAVRHGIASRVEPGTVEIRTSRIGDALLVTVRDDGMGLAKGWDQARENGGGMGLRNVRARLEQTYPGRHRFSIENAAGGGCLVTIEIPFTMCVPEEPA